MNPRLLIVAGVVAALAFAGMLAGYLARDSGSGGRGGDARADGVVAQETGLRGARIPPGVLAPDFELRDQDGETLRMRDLRGKIVAVTFLYTHCEDTCPATAQQIRGALDDLGHDVPVVAVSVDPRNDTEASARAFLSEQRVTGRIRFALGSREQLEPIWNAYGTSPQKVQQEHSARLVLVDRRGRQRIGFPMQQTSPDMIAHDLRVLEAEKD
jgi:protein SCO1/2